MAFGLRPLRSYTSVLLICFLSSFRLLFFELRLCEGRSRSFAMDSSGVEVFILLAVGHSVIALRTYARISSVGFERLQADDYLMLIAAVSHPRPCIQISLTTLR